MGRMESIPVSGSPMRVYRDGTGSRPGVVVMTHGPGLDRFIEAQVEALASAGYLAAAPDLFHRQPDDGSDTMARVGRLRDREIVEDADAAAAHLRACGASALAVVGFCMGGRHTYLLAGARPQVWSAAGVFYGGNIMTAWGDGPSPFDRTDQIACPVLGLFGEDDTNPSPADVAKLDAELTRHGKPHTFHSYAGAGHAFLNFTNPERHRPAQAAEAWAKLLEFLAVTVPH
jgi:carboxymethylenebutenolidase